MEVTFSNETCASYFNDANLMRRKLDAKIIKALYKRFFELQAFESSSDLIVSGLDHPHYLAGNYKGLLARSIDKKYRLILSFSGGEKDKKNQIAIIKGVVDYHGSKDKWIIA